MPSLSKEEQRVAIAEFCGVTNRWVLMKRGMYYRPNAKGYTFELRDAWIVSEQIADEHTCPYDEPVTKHRAPLPNYPDDLNAMHEAEKFLSSTRQRLDYETHLNAAVQPVGAMPYSDRVFFLYNATANQRAEALLRTIGKWKD